MYGPAVDDAPLDSAVFPILEWTTLALEPLPPFPQLVQAAAGRRARILWVLREGDSSAALAVAEAIGEQPVVHLLREGVRVPERHVRLVRGGLRRDLVQDLAHLRRLILGPFPNGRASSYFRVLLLYLRRSS